MKKTITIGSGESAKDVTFEATALFPHAMREIFHVNVFEKFQGLNIDNITASDEMVDLISQMAFVLAKTPEAKTARDLMGLTMDDYYEWLCQFDTFDLLDSASEIMDVYLGSKRNLSESKNPESLQ